MKKMILKAAACAALATAMVLTGCSSDEGGDSDIISVKGTSASISSLNDSGETRKRGFATIRATEKSAADCTIVMNNAKNNGSSVMGFVFDEHEGKDADGATIYDFYLAGVRYYSGKPQYYLSHFENVKSSELTGSQDSFGKETAIVKGTTTAYADLPDSVMNGDDLTVTVSVTQADTGKYVVTLKNKNLDPVEPVGSVGTIDLKDGKQQGKIGFYAMITKDNELNGEWTLANIKEAAEIVEE
ncbi:MAG: hypothetical protein K2H09_04830 [Treponemataceae bacterium]|nr:hypothetical protein [Treponemataceae bacterium]